MNYPLKDPTGCLKKTAVIFLLLGSMACRKSVDSPNTGSTATTSTVPDMARPYLGVYTVSEVASVLYPAGDTTYSTFTGQIIRDSMGWLSPASDGLSFEDSLNVIDFVQSGRNPAPIWASPGRGSNFGSDTITFKFYQDSASRMNDTLVSSYITTATAQIISKDTILLNYFFGSGPIAYVVSQTWVKQ